VFCIAKPEVCSEKAITKGDFPWLFHRYWNGNEVHVNQCHLVNLKVRFSLRGSNLTFYAKIKKSD